MPWESAKVTLTKEQRTELKKIAGSKKTSEKEKCRAIVVLLLGEGLKNKEIAKRLHIHENTVVKWRQRWRDDNEDPKSVSDYGELTGRPRSILTNEGLDRVRRAMCAAPTDGRDVWTVRSLAHALCLPVATTQRALLELGIYANGKTRKG